MAAVTSYSLRPYQEECLQTIMKALPTDQYILIQAACGFGKTILASELIKRLLTQWPKIRIAFLAHRGILITQTRDKLLKVWPESDSLVGIASGGIDNNVDTEKPITIGTIQTIVHKVETTKPYDLIICDEAHRISPMNIKSQYKTFIDTMNKYNPNTRIIGLTGSPYRLGHGYIYGGMCRKGNINLFTDLHYRMPIAELQKQGFLCGYRAKVLADITSDLKGVRKTGDYNIGDLEKVMGKPQHVGSAVNTLNEYAKDRRHVVVFACTISHAEKLCEAFGIEQSTIIHSQLPKEDREKAISDFENGTRRIMVNVNILCEGFDSPATDCVIMCRPTCSPSMFIQQIGRGLRPHPDKTDVLILDLANNCLTHGDPDSPQVIIPGRGETIIKKKPHKVCPVCKEMIPIASRVCPVCGSGIVIDNSVQEDGEVKLKDYDFKKPSDSGINVEIGDAVFTKYVSKSGNLMCKLNLETYHNNGEIPIHVNNYFMFDHDHHPYAVGKSRSIWKKITGNDPPGSTQEAIDRERELYSGLAALDTIEIKLDNKFWKVENWG